jgi:hypothetical protein
MAFKFAGRRPFWEATNGTISTWRGRCCGEARNTIHGYSEKGDLMFILGERCTITCRSEHSRFLSVASWTWSRDDADEPGLSHLRADFLRQFVCNPQCIHARP